MTCSVLTCNRVALVGKCKGVRDIFGSKSCGVAYNIIKRHAHEVKARGKSARGSLLWMFCLEVTGWSNAATRHNGQTRIV